MPIPDNFQPVTRPPRASEAGSVLMYILLAVALFAALSFSVANIMRSGGGDPNREAMNLQSTDVLQYGDGLKRAVQGMRIRSVADNQISFENPQVGGYSPHGSCSADTCRVFRPSGGGIAYMPPTDSWLDITRSAEPLYGQWFFPAGVCVEGVGTGDSTCSSDTEDNEELLAILPWVNRQLCIQLNERLGVLNPGGEPPVATGAAWPGSNTKFTGTYTESAIIARGGAAAGCLRGNGTPPNNSYFYYKVLLAR